MKLWCSMRHNDHFVLFAFHCWLISQIFWLDDCIISKNLVTCVVCVVCVCVRVSFWHCQSQSAGAITSHSHHLQCKDMLRTSRIKGVCQRECVGETTLISAFQPVLLGILATIPHQANGTVIRFVRLYSKKAKDIWMYCHCLLVGSI